MPGHDEQAVPASAEAASAQKPKREKTFKETFPNPANREAVARLSFQFPQLAFGFEPIREIEDVRRLVPFMKEDEVQAYLLERSDRIVCRYCPRAAEHWERMNRDPEYKVAICTVCRDKEVARITAAREPKKDPYEGRYIVTAQQAQDSARERQGFLVRELRAQGKTVQQEKQAA